MKIRRAEYRRLREWLLPAAGLGLLLAVILLLRAPSGSAPDAFTPHQAPALQSIALEIGKKGMWKLRAKREAAMAAGLLITESDDWVGGTLREGNRSWRIRLRLKGDWTDHLADGKW
ncbi:MAG: hypothetical protein AAF570_06850, partial [Bacteroidota bacterium]